MTVRDLIRDLQQGIENGSWEANGEVIVANADEGGCHDLHGPAKHDLAEIVEGKLGDCVLWIGN